jgi:DNA invertase Pin-like site-specific DNA recombinase
MPQNKNCRAIELLTAASNLSFPPEARQTILRDYAVMKSLEIVSFLAWDGNDSYSGWLHAIDFAKNSCAPTIIVDDMSTIILTVEQLINVIDALVINNLTLDLANDRVEFDAIYLGAMRNLLAMTKWAEGKKRSESIKKSLKLKKAQGQRLGGQRFGVLAHEANVVQQILKLHEQGSSLQQICQALALTDIKTVRNKKWHPTTIKRIIERSKSFKTIS